MNDESNSDVGEGEDDFDEEDSEDQKGSFLYNLGVVILALLFIFFGAFVGYQYHINEVVKDCNEFMMSNCLCNGSYNTVPFVKNFTVDIKEVGANGFKNTAYGAYGT